MDYFELLKTVEALQVVLGGSRIRSCRQFHTRILVFHMSGSTIRGTGDSLVFDLSSRFRGVFLTDMPPDRTAETLLARSFRNKTAGATVTDIRMPFPDRSVRITLTLPEWPASRELWIEFMGQCTNVTLVDSGSDTILECLTKFPEDQGHSPLRMPGRRFEPMWRRVQRELKPLAGLTEPDASWPVDGSESGMASELLASRAPMTPRLAADIARTYIESGAGAAAQRVLQVLNDLSGEKPSRDAAVQHLARSAEEWMEKRESAVFNDRRGQIVRRMTAALNKCRKNIRAAERDMKNLPDARKLRETADSLAAAFHTVRPGMTVIQVPNIHHPADPPLQISLDPKLSPRGNLDRLFRRTRKADRSLPRINARLDELRREEQAIESMLDTIDSTCSGRDLDTIEKKLRDAGFIQIPGGSSGHDAMLTRKPYLRAQSPDGWDIWVGRSATENDMLTFRDAAPHDFWLHAHGTRGAHVVIRNPQKRREPPARTRDLAVRMAIYYSKARGEKAVSVFLSMKKHVRKAPGNIPGRAIVTKHETLTADSPETVSWVAKDR
ncbi:MAG TPA: NFACT RNA binding domain-containing protein [bacterium]|nr:NFACT RNA binding domain-containing protein [bacterium]